MSKRICVRCGGSGKGTLKTELGYICMACFKAWNQGKWTTEELRKQLEHERIIDEAAEAASADLDGGYDEYASQ